MKQTNFEFRVLVHGKPINEHHHKGDVFVEGRPGSEYTLEFRNNSMGRVLAVVSVDGLSVMDGEPAGFDSGGYIVEPCSKLLIPGWRLDNEEVARFCFSRKKRSYAKKSGKPKDIGVIGCAVFHEDLPAFTFTVTEPQREEHHHHHHYGWPYYPAFPRVMWTTVGEDNSGQTSPSSRLDYSANLGDVTVDAVEANYLSVGSSYDAESASCAVKSEQPLDVQNVGTAFGKRDDHAVKSEEFKHVEKPACILVVRYDDRAGLKARGVRMHKSRPRIAVPFPKEQSGCKPPPGWQG
jgi:hypothetical protein